MNQKLFGFFALLLSLCLLGGNVAPAQEASRPLALRPMPVGKWLEEEAVTVVVPAYDIGKPTDIFDGKSETLLRSMDVNPLQVYIDLDDPKAVRAIRVLISHHVGRWKLEVRRENGPAQLEELVTWTEARDGEASEVVLPASVSVTALRLTIERIGGDNYVHLNEWELLQEVVSENNAP